MATMSNMFTGSPIDRVGVDRKSETFVAERLRRPTTLILPVGAGGHLVAEADPGAARAGLRSLDEAPELAARLADTPWVLLGLLDGDAVIALDLGAGAPALGAGERMEELRPLAARLPAPEAAMLAHARALLNWRRTHRFCGKCGHGCEPIEGGTVMQCAACGTHHFPRTDPAVIMRVTCGDRILLARATRFEGRMFSVLAGFVEPGESLEEAVAREVFEECGLRTAGIRYHSSQPWPFPGSVMLGFVARSDDDRISIDPEEIAEAAFFTRDAVRDRAAHGWDIPPPLSIAHRMIDDWLEERA